MADDPNVDTIAQAASATQQMIPKQQGPLTTFQPQPMMPPPLPRFQTPQAQVSKAGNEFQTVSGRKRADRQAIIGNLTSMVKAGSDYIVAKKQRDLSMKLERMMSAIEGLNEAKASGDQEAIKRNSAILNDLTSDPKTSKLFQKALNIDLFGNGKNKNENQAFLTAWQNFQREKQKDPNALNPNAQRIMQSMPMRQGLSPEAQAQAAAIKAGLAPEAGQVLQTFRDNYKTLMEAKTQDEKTAILKKIADDRIAAEKYKADKVLDGVLARGADQATVARINQYTQLRKAQITASTWDARLAKMGEIAAMKQQGGPYSNLYKQMQANTAEMKTLNADNDKMQAELDKMEPSTIGKIFGQRAPDTPDTKRMKMQIQINQYKVNKLTQDNMEAVTRMKMLDAAGVGAAGDVLKDHDNPDNDGTPQEGDTDTGL